MCKKIHGADAVFEEVSDVLGLYPDSEDDVMQAHQVDREVPSA